MTWSRGSFSKITAATVYKMGWGRNGTGRDRTGQEEGHDFWQSDWHSSPRKRTMSGSGRGSCSGEVTGVAGQGACLHADGVSGVTSDIWV